MKKRKTWIYNCEYCGTHKHQFPAIQRHEARCSKNPKNKRACFGCVYLTKKKTMYYFETYYSEDSQELELLYCTKKKHFLYPPNTEYKENWFDLGYELNEPMPKECDVCNNLN